MISTPNILQGQISDRLAELAERLAQLFKFIKKGTLLRDAQQESYQGRVEYTQYLREFIYNPAALNIIFSQSALKEKFFRTFGYQGNLDFTIYPHAWIRDLALADYEIGPGVYLADGIVLGTNQVTPCQKKVKVAPIQIGAHSIFDQHCKIGLRTKIGKDCRIGVSCHIGLLCQLGNFVQMGPLAAVGHYAKICDGVILGAQTTIGAGSIVEAETVLDDYIKIPRCSYVSRSGKVTRINAETIITEEMHA